MLLINMKKVSTILFSYVPVTVMNIELNKELDKIEASQSNCIWNWLQREELDTEDYI